ncbi:MAG TPA: hypothetical protein VEZ15_01535 [Acidimicrobiia bacterium]|nr:hypothetical protein [Acidimicrobiia bacterium]
MQDDLQLTEALGRALELPLREPSPERIAALQRQVRRQRLRRPLRRAAVAAAVALIALAGATLAVGTSHQKETSSADAVAISNTLRDIQEVQQAIKERNTAQIRKSTAELVSQLGRLDPAQKAAVGPLANAVITQAQRAAAPVPVPGSPSSASTTSSSTASTTTTSSTSTTTSTTSSTTSTTTTTTIPASTATTAPGP